MTGRSAWRTLLGRHDDRGPTHGRGPAIAISPTSPTGLPRRRNPGHPDG
ncbi:hypothetical protein H7K45_13775 [Mycobacterium yunnanensis]|uniref:Uncharacterized protein n=1 Tax=Mycobacterium yunnanensis TaxID=368477 RepID=A0A9X3C2Q6_9MYCO|nr:hypothetical protein [Mycobacterium yunnanensis]MCV7421611.1 hypothetical protein [Mycobacterium yunnanensis]